LIWTSDCLYFSKNIGDDYYVIQSAVKPPNAKYVGFGEQGGLHLVKNNEQVTYFNYDNMRYRQVNIRRGMRVNGDEEGDLGSKEDYIS
jgi:hypothetical protein